MPVRVGHKVQAMLRPIHLIDGGLEPHGTPFCGNV